MTLHWSGIEMSQDLCVGIHEHACPRCYERKLCTKVCSREPEQETDNGIQAGCIATCDECAAMQAAGGDKCT